MPVAGDFREVFEQALKLGVSTRQIPLADELRLGCLGKRCIPGTVGDSRFARFLRVGLARRPLEQVSCLRQRRRVRGGPSDWPRSAIRSDQSEQRVILRVYHTTSCRPNL